MISLKRLTIPKNLKEGPLGLFQHQFVAKYQKIEEGHLEKNVQMSAEKKLATVIVALIF